MPVCDWTISRIPKIDSRPSVDWKEAIKDTQINNRVSKVIQRQQQKAVSTATKSGKKLLAHLCHNRNIDIIKAKLLFCNRNLEKRKNHQNKRKTMTRSQFKNSFKIRNKYHSKTNYTRRRW